MMEMQHLMRVDASDFTPLVSMFTPPIIKKKKHLMTAKERSDSKVPDDMKQWIFRPEISAIFTRQHQASK